MRIHKSTIMKLGGLVVVVVVAAAAYRFLPWSIIGPKVEQRRSEIGLTPNEIAANGPLPGALRLYAKELACAKALPTPGYFSSINAAELADAQRSGVFPCELSRLAGGGHRR